MKLKKWRKEIRKALSHATRDVWVRLAGLPRRERWRLAWLLIKGDPDIGKAVKRK